jgi:hypothetical protein
MKDSEWNRTAAKEAAEFADYDVRCGSGNDVTRVALLSAVIKGRTDYDVRCGSGNDVT